MRRRVFARRSLRPTNRVIRTIWSCSKPLSYVVSRFVVVTAEPPDNADRIFESLNNTGLGLMDTSGSNHDSISSEFSKSSRL